MAPNREEILRGPNGEYTVGDQLGKGTFGVVYRGRRLSDNLPVAIKKLSPSVSLVKLVEYADAMNIFQREATVTQNLRHRHIISIYDAWRDDSEQKFYIVMQLAEAGPLKEYSPVGTLLSPLLTGRYVLQAAQALQYAHEQSVLHRDVKPENMLLHAQAPNSPLEILLSDFGAVTAAHTAASLKTTDVIGTPTYMSPEQIQGKPTKKSDQYSLAVVAFRLLCGRAPFTGENHYQIMWAHIERPVPVFGHIVGRAMNDLLKAVEPVVLKALEKDENRRYPQVIDFAEDFNAKLQAALFAEERQHGRVVERAAIPEIESRKWVEQARIYANAGKFQLALNAYHHAIQAYPKNASAHYEKGLVLESLGGHDEAFQAFEQAILLDPKNNDAHFHKGNALKKLGRYEEAVSAYDLAIQLNPARSEVQYEKAGAFEKLGRMQEALAADDKAIQLRPRFLAAYFQKARILEGKAQIAEAVHVYDQIVHMEPLNGNAYFLKGHLLHKQRRFDEAIIAYDQAIRVNPTHSDAYYWKAYALERQGNDESALTVYDQVIRLDPINSDAYYRVAEICERLGKNDQALQAYDKAIQYDNEYNASFHEKGHLVPHINRIEEDNVAYRTSFFTSDNSYMYYALTNLLHKMERYEEELTVYDQIISKYPGYGKAYVRKGLLLAQLGRYEEAIAPYDQAIIAYQQRSSTTHYGGDYEQWKIWSLKAEAYEALGKVEEALYIYDEVIRWKGSGDAYFENIKALERYGRHDQAMQIYVEYLKAETTFRSPSGKIGMVPLADPYWQEAMLNTLGIQEQHVLSKLEEAIKSEPDNRILLYQFYKLKGKTLISLSRRQEALAAFQNAQKYYGRDGYLNEATFDLEVQLAQEDQEE